MIHWVDQQQKLLVKNEADFVPKIIINEHGDTILNNGNGKNS